VWRSPGALVVFASGLLLVVAALASRGSAGTLAVVAGSGRDPAAGAVVADEGEDGARLGREPSRAGRAAVP
jgi:hypothetical protein